jgi:sulfofructose kinase
VRPVQHHAELLPWPNEDAKITGNMTDTPQDIEMVGLGVATVDVLALADHLPAADEVLPATAVALSSGGPVATAMVTAAKLGRQVAFLDAEGDDWQGRYIRQDLVSSGVCVDHVVIRPGARSAISSILIRESDGARSIVFDSGNAQELSVDELPFDLIARARIIHTNGRHPAACMAAAEVVHRGGGLVAFDGGHGRFRPAIRPLIGSVDLCIVAAGFATAFTGVETLDVAAGVLLGEGPSLVVITDGVRGSWAWDRHGQKWYQPAFSMPKVVDTTGCGDSYHGAFLAAMLEGRSVPDAMALASAVAALNTQGLGGRIALPTRAQAQAFVDARNAGFVPAQRG